MSASQPAYFSLQQFSDLGALLVGGRLYTYAQGTTTFKTAYTDPAGAVPQTYTADGLGGQYIALNARGELPAPLYLSPGSYDIALKRADGSTLWTRRADAIGETATALAASGGAGLVSFLQAASNALARTVQDRLYDDLYLTDFMTTAEKTDFRTAANSVDLSGAVQRMVNSASRPSNLRIPAGYAKLGSTITFPPSIYLRFVGAGIGITTFEFWGSGNAMESQSLVSNTQKTSFEEFTLVNHPGNTNSTNGIYLRNGQYWSNIKNVFVDGFNKTGTQTYNGQNYYYSGIFAIDSWGAEWDRVMIRRCGVGLTLSQCTGVYKNLDIQANVQHGAFIEDSPATILGGVFEGNSTSDNGNAASTTRNAEIYLMGGETKIIGAFIEGEGINPAWSVVIDGRDAFHRSFGGGVFDCPINRSGDTSRVRGCIKLDYCEEPVIEGNSIMPTAAGAGAATIPHINVTANPKNPRIGKNTWRGRQWYVGASYSNACPIFLSSEMTALTVPYSYDSVGGGLNTSLKRLRYSWLVPGPLTAPQAETSGNIGGGTQTHTVWVERLSWLTGVIMTDNAGLAAGNVTVRIYNRVNGAGALVLLQTIVQGAYSGTSKVLLSQHPYITRVDAGHILATVQTDATFAPTVGSEITVEVLIEEDDTH